MQTEDLIRLAEKVQHFRCEFQTIEVKAAHVGCPTRLYDSLSSFSNQDEGGVILFGLDEKKAFEAVGVYDVQDLQHKVAEQCKQMEPEVRPLFTVAELQGRYIVSAEIPGVEADQRPVYYRGVGRQKGSYVRVGESDEPMNDYEIYSYDAFRRRVRDDIRIVEGAKLSQLREEELQRYMNAIKENSANLSHGVADDELMELMGLTRDGKPTMAAVLAFGKYPQAYFPMLGVTAVVVPGTQTGDTGADGERFLANQRINGTISEMLDGAVEFVRRNSRVKTVINEDGQRKDKPEFPIRAVREVILNALLHRDYSVHAESSPITICMFSDRMEVTSKGGLYGRISVSQLGKVHAEIRNTTLVSVLEALHVTENRYSGIPTIRREMEAAGLPAPEFVARSGEFKVILRNNMNREYYTQAPAASRIAEGGSPWSSRNSGRSREEELLDFCSVPRSREELTEFLGFSRYYVMDRMVKPLLESGRLVMTMPDKPKSKRQRYVRTEEYIGNAGN
ncbi:MAG: putative DNA binding domain-containing protein [Lachnospiraceae bacterium]|nr:putative DNA binding domain-containing protein [Lachnospiraceae bacterium]